MNAKEQIMHRFYSAFQKLDYKTMQDSYHPDAVFSDPAFGLLDAAEVKSMWEMLCKRAIDFSLSFSEIKSEDEYGTCHWKAVYTFSITGRKVVNEIKAYMKFSDGKILEHSDAFSLHKWSRQALGWKGWLLGWSGFFQKKLQAKSRKNLHGFMKKELGIGN